MKILTVLLSIIGVLSTAACQTKAKANSESFINAEQAKIKQHAKMLVTMGHMSSDYADRIAYLILGKYAWHGDGKGYFGAYSFYEPAFEQAKRGWFLHGKVVEGSNELWPQDDFDFATQREEIKFDKSIIGYALPEMGMSWFENGHYISAGFKAKIIGITEDGRAAILDKAAPHQAENWRMEIVPTDWQDMCDCTAGSAPPFAGAPAIEEPGDHVCSPSTCPE